MALQIQTEQLCFTKMEKIRGNNPYECMYSSQSFGKGNNSEINKEFRKKPLIAAKFTSKGRKAMHKHALVIQKYLKTQKSPLPETLS